LVYKRLTKLYIKVAHYRCNNKVAHKHEIFDTFKPYFYINFIFIL